MIDLVCVSAFLCFDTSTFLCLNILPYFEENFNTAMMHAVTLLLLQAYSVFAGDILDNGADFSQVNWES